MHRLWMAADQGTATHYFKVQPHRPHGEHAAEAERLYSFQSRLAAPKLLYSAVRERGREVRPFG